MTDGSGRTESIESQSPAATGQLYTPAMLAELLHVPIRAIRLWERAGLLKPAAVVMKIPHFSYAEITTARSFVRWVQQGLTAHAIVRQVTQLRERCGALDLDVGALPIVVEGRRLVLKQGDLRLEANGQLHFGFDAEEHLSAPEVVTLKFESPVETPRWQGEADDASERDLPKTLEAMMEAAETAEDLDDLDAAVDWYRSALAAFGPNSSVCFQLAELLYRQADLSGARERYFMAIELDPGLVEARANLGCVLAECGQLELAVAAFEGALEQYSDYADVHFHLARALDELGLTAKANGHWQTFLRLAPASPWADEAQERLKHLAPTLDF